MPVVRRPSQPRWEFVPISVLLVALLLVPGSAVAGSPNPPAPGPVQWAYAGQNSTLGLLPVSGTLGGVYAVHASFATTAIFSQWNTSSSGFSVGMNRTVSFVLFADLCSLPCAPGGPFVNLSIRAWEVDELTANLTRSGTVHLGNGPALPAFALLSSESLLFQNLTERLSWQVASGAGSVTRSAQSRLDVSVDLGPGGLGLFPVSPPTNTSWNSSAIGAVSGNYQVGCTVIAVNRSSSCGPGFGLLAGTALFAVSGIDRGYTAQSDGGAPTQGMALSLTSPGTFVLEDGVLLVPTVADLFGSSETSPNPAPFQQVSTSELNWLGQAGHLGVVASTTLFAPHLPGTSKNVAGAPALSSAAQPAQSSLGTYTVYGAPVSPTEAHNQSCQEISGCTGIPGGGGPGGGSGPGSSGSGLLLKVALGGVVVATILLAVVMAFRPRHRASLPPTGAGETLPPPPPVPPGEEDPLGRLW